MKKRIYFLILVFLAPVPGMAQNKPVRTHINPDFNNYLDLKKQGKWNSGIKPAPFKLNFDALKDSSDHFKSDTRYPSRYDLRESGLVTVPKNQGGGQFGGNCVSFATMGSLESRMLDLGLGEFDLSEQNMAACHGYEWVYGDGANEFIATAYLTRFSGPVLESQHEYDLDSFPCYEYPPLCLVPEARWLPTKDYSSLKQAIMDFGAVYTSIHINFGSFDDSNDSYFYSGSQAGNHALLCCGWDDNFETAGGKGAWIVKNSWGTGWGDAGFVYVSYNDTRFAEDIAYYPIRWEKDAIDTVYMYDRLGLTDILGFLNSSKIHQMAKFTTPEEQQITRIGFAVVEPETVVDIKAVNPGNKLLATRSNILVEYPGFYTFELPFRIKGDFYVKVSQQFTGNVAPVAIETYVDGYADPILEQGVNWISEDGENWDPTNPPGSSSGYNLTIRAYAVKTGKPRALFSSDKTLVCPGADILFSFQENEAVDSYHWEFGEGANPAAASGIGPHQVSYATEGLKTVSLRVNGPAGTDSLIRPQYIKVDGEIDVDIPRLEDKVLINTAYELKAYGAEVYGWYPGELIDYKGNGESVSISLPSVGKYTVIVTGYLLSGSEPVCYASDTITLTGLDPPPHDNKCDPYLLETEGFIGLFDNSNATVEADEPYPPGTSCLEPLQWCDEQGLQHTIWFSFIGPASGLVTIETSGIDNQLAIYKADTCSDLIYSKCMNGIADECDLIAANDDQTSSIYPALISGQQVVPGQKYFIQLDGSAGGVEGISSFNFYTRFTGTDDLHRDHPEIRIYPNPGKEIFQVELHNLSPGTVHLTVYSMNGIMIEERMIMSDGNQLQTSLNLKEQPEGIYYLRIISADAVISSKLIKY